MIAVGLTGGIGSGKSTVAGRLVARGAVLIDSDQIAREVVERGGPAYAKVVERFGPSVVSGDGAIDRPALASIVFADAEALAELNSIVHPEVRTEIARQLRARAGGHDVIVIDIPLLVETGGRDAYGLNGVLVVDCPADVVLQRLEARGMARSDAEARIRAQASRRERVGAADFVIMNMGSLDELDEMVGRAWSWIESLRGAEAGDGGPAFGR
jgi:dephospho-CoA kinase